MAGLGWEIVSLRKSSRSAASASVGGAYGSVTAMGVPRSVAFAWMSSERRQEAAVAATLWALVAGVIGLYLVLFVLSAAGRLTSPTAEFTYGESWLLDGARRVARGEGL